MKDGGIKGNYQLETVLRRLDFLYSTIITLHMGLKREQTEEQALACIECIGYCVNDIKRYIHDELVE